MTVFDVLPQVLYTVASGAVFSRPNFRNPCDEKPKFLLKIPLQIQRRNSDTSNSIDVLSKEIIKNLGNTDM